MLPGSGIGPELMNYVKEVFRYKMKQNPHIALSENPWTYSHYSVC